MSAFLKLGVPPQQLETVTLPFGEWLPDVLGLNSPGATEALNVIPTEGGYAPVRKIAPVTGLFTPDACRGAISYDTPRGDVRLYAGTVYGLYARVGSAMALALGAEFSTPLLDRYLWQFVPFGDNMVALHPQKNPLSTNVYGAGMFTDVGGNPPKAACGARVGDFLVLGNLEDTTDGRQPQRIRWGGFNRLDADWTSDPNTQADFQDMPAEGGAVIGIVGRETGTIFQEHIISRMTYVGLPDVFDIETVEAGRGAISVGSIVDVGAAIYFAADDGFYMWNGVNSTPISSNKITRYFRGRLNYAERGRIVGALDAENECIRWAFPVGSGTALEEQLIYSYKENRWTHAFITLEYLLAGSRLGVSLDDLTEDIDTDYPLSFDDPSYQHGTTVLSGFNTDHVFGYCNGSTLEPVIETADASGPNGTRVWVTNARPIVDTAHYVSFISVGKREQLLGEDVVYSTKVLQELTGVCPVLDEARFMRFRMGVRAGEEWKHAMGVEIERKAGGKR